MLKSNRAPVKAAVSSHEDLIHDLYFELERFCNRSPAEFEIQTVDCAKVIRLRPDAECFAKMVLTENGLGMASFTLYHPDILIVEIGPKIFLAGIRDRAADLINTHAPFLNRRAFKPETIRGRMRSLKDDMDRLMDRSIQYADLFEDLSRMRTAKVEFI
jgi:hypothetical protein